MRWHVKHVEHSINAYSTQCSEHRPEQVETYLRDMARKLPNLNRLHKLLIRPVCDQFIYHARIGEGGGVSHVFYVVLGDLS